MALDNGKLSLIETDVNKAAYRLIKRMVDGDSEFITIIVGEDIDDSTAAQLRERVEEKFGSRMDINVIRGDQPVYYYIVSVE